MAYCSECGSILPEKGNACVNCGRPIAAVDACELDLESPNSSPKLNPYEYFPSFLQKAILWYLKTWERFPLITKILISACAVAIVLFAALFASGVLESKQGVDVNEQIEMLVQGDAVAHCLQYKDVRTVTVSVATSILVQDASDSGYTVYDVYGYLTIIDLYGDQYKAKYTATVYLDENYDGYCDDFEAEAPIKEK